RVEGDGRAVVIAHREHAEAAGVLKGGREPASPASLWEPLQVDVGGRTGSLAEPAPHESAAAQHRNNMVVGTDRSVQRVEELDEHLRRRGGALGSDSGHGVLLGNHGVSCGNQPASSARFESCTVYSDSTSMIRSPAPSRAASKH